MSSTQTSTPHGVGFGFARGRSGRTWRVARLLGAGAVLATAVVAAPASGSPVPVAHHASSSTCTAQLRQAAATMSELTGREVSCTYAALLLRKES